MRDDCDFCGSPVESTPFPDRHTVYYRSRCRCGSAYAVEASELAMVSGELTDLRKRQITRLLFERHILARSPPLLVLVPQHLDAAKSVPDFVIISVDDWLRENWPTNVLDRIDRTLCNLARMSKSGGAVLKLEADDRAAVSTSIDETEFILDSLVQRGMCTAERLRRPQFGLVKITPEGWGRFRELSRTGSDRRNPVFVAMWFGSQVRKGEAEHVARMQSLYEAAISPGVRAAGFRVKKADTEEHNDYIMDRIRADIRQAPFVVADLSGQNLGVYYEAGLAAGLGIPVIPCCPDEQDRRVHFDVAQVNQIRYSTLEELTSRLTNRILGSIGRGPYKEDGTE